jgi:hypothetical protein
MDRLRLSLIFLNVNTGGLARFTVFSSVFVGNKVDELVKRPISALRPPFVTATYNKYAAFGTRDRGILRIRKP